MEGRAKTDGEVRQTGIEIIGEVPWGTHLCQFHKDPQDLIEILVPYFKAGLENNEFCLWVTSEPLDAEDALEALAREIPDLEDYVQREQIEILDYSQWYTPGGKFDSDRVLRGCVGKLETALKRGFEGLRLTGNTSWLAKSDWQNFTEYEAAIGGVIGGYPMVAICTYSLAKCDAAEIMEVVSHHAFALTRRADEWQVIENAERKHTEQALREREQRVRHKLESILSPQVDIARLELADIIDSAGIQSLMEEFYTLTHLPMAILDLKGSVLVGVGWQDICTKFHRVHPESCRNCLESDTKLTTGVPPGEFRLYKCQNNMWDVATPLTIGGRHVGNLFLGQFFFDDDSADYELFRAQARRYGFNEQEYLAALERVPRLTRERLNAGMAFLAKLGHMVSLLSYSNIKLARSLTEREALMNSLKDSQNRLSRAQEIAHLGSWELDLLTSHLSWSDEVYRIFGLQPQEFGATYQAFLDAVHPEDRPAVHAAYSSSVRDGTSCEITHRVVQKSTGEVRWVHEKCEHVRDGDGKTIRSVGAIQDITDRKRAEDALRQAQKMESIGFLAGGIAHDFNNLLTGIMGHASMVLDNSDPDSAERIKEVIRGAERAAKLTSQLLAYSGKGQFVVRDLDISQAVNEMSDLVQFSIPKSVNLSLNLQKRLPLVRMDPSQLEQVLMNLAINAGEAIGEGRPGKISITTAVTDVEEPFTDAIGQQAAPGRYVSIEVSDTGSGIDQDAKSKLFDPFFTTKFTGRGLGLAAVAGIVRSQKGAITLESFPGRGTTFRLLLPVADNAQHSEGQHDVSGRATILVVDDDASVRKFIGGVLRREKYRVLEASDGRDALAVCDREGGKIDGIVLDVVMPVMGANDLLPALKARQPNVKVLLTSGYTEFEARRLCDEYPGAAFIQKPYTARQIAKAVEGLLGAVGAA